MNPVAFDIFMKTSVFLTISVLGYFVFFRAW